ncbi:hypothetical protein WS62_06845 [Burkholderia sp. ABCPW 14]|uniref:hypothetical protein n=1 Tax=Burkholderia sp. ABCPW 14 TaxID=1637860 RepID=UPI000770BDC0|nr:hypothetical protein [Burkholderia sp. ABCPW 14]KVD74178.1 hypothetical protein WS62_06845 [Burkholderia sp. ABCPW 14]
MTVSVAGKLIPQPDALSDVGQRALEFVDGGTEWLDWAATAPTARYDFADETELIATVQQGLHVSRHTLLPQLGLMVSPVKLMTLSLADLNVLARAESGDGSSVVAAQVAKILSEHGLATRDELAAGVSFLAQLGVKSAPLFQVLGFDESLAVTNLMHLPQSARQQPLQQEAATFALKQARTVHEFCDFYRFYLDYAEQLNSGAATPERREAAATEASQALLPVLFGALDCPQVQGLAGPSEVAQTVRNWLAQGRLVGFARLSQGAQQIVQHTAYKGETGEAAKRIVDLFMHAAQSFLAAHQPERGTMGQDGATCLFPVESAQLRAELQLSSNGVISLNDFGTRPAAPASLAPIETERASTEQENAS